MPSFPTGIVSLSDNFDNSTVVNAFYMDARDDEIEAIETSLGAGLVSSTALTDDDERLSGYMTTSNEGYLSLGYTNGKNVRVGDGNMAYTPQVPSRSCQPTHVSACMTRTAPTCRYGPTTTSSRFIASTTMAQRGSGCSRSTRAPRRTPLSSTLPGTSDWGWVASPPLRLRLT